LNPLLPKLKLKGNYILELIFRFGMRKGEFCLCFGCGGVVMEGVVFGMDEVRYGRYRKEGRYW